MAATQDVHRPTDQATSERYELERRLNALSEARRRLEGALRDVHPPGKQRTG